MARESDTSEFCPFESAEVWDEINRLEITKKTSGDVPTHILKLTSDFSFSAVTKLAIEMVQQCTFPDKLKLADVSPVFESKVSERLLLKKFLPFIEKRLGDSLRFRKRKLYSTRSISVC